MFEGWASELLASYLGHFFDVKKEQLRISLWSGEFGPTTEILLHVKANSSLIGEMQAFITLNAEKNVGFYIDTIQV
jgi:hypothetical protein